MSERHEIVDALVLLGRPNAEFDSPWWISNHELVRKVEAYLTQLETKNRKLKWRLSNLKEEIRAALNKLEESHE